MLTPSNGAFATTAWSQILLAKGHDRESKCRFESLEFLCNTYWAPVYAFIRRRGKSDDQALDLTQDYFALFLEKNFLDQVRPDKGRFRTFLLASVKNFLSNEADYRNAARRAPRGKVLSLSIDADSANVVAISVAASSESADAIFMREWARAAVELAMRRMREYCAEKDLVDYCPVLEHTIAHSDASYESTALALGWRVDKVRKTLHRARKKFAEILRATVRESVGDDEDIEDELRDLRKFFT